MSPQAKGSQNARTKCHVQLDTEILGWLLKLSLTHVVSRTMMKADASGTAADAV